MKRNALVAVITSLLLTTSLLAGCGKKDAVPTNNAAEDKEVVIKLGCWGSSPAETKLLDDQIAEFNKEFPKIKVQKEVITNDYNQAMQTRIASKTDPDVFYLDVSLAPAYMEKATAPIDEYLDKEDLKDFNENLLKGFQKDGKTYGLPKDYNSLAIFYNQEMLDKAGVKPPTTWAELEEASKKLTKDGVKALALADDSARFVPFIFQAGGKVMDGEKIAFNTPEAAKALDFYYSFVKNGQAADPKSLGEGWNGDALAHKKVAMVIEGGWMIPFMKESAPDVKYGISALPKGEQTGNLAFTVAYAMSKNTKNPKQSAELIKFLTGKKAQEMTADSGLAIPTRKSMADVYTSKYPERAALVEGAKGAEVFCYGEKHAKIQDALAKAGEKLRLNKLPDGKAALEDAEKASMQ